MSLRSRLRAALFAFVNDSRTERMMGELAWERDSLRTQLDSVLAEREELIGVAGDALAAAGGSVP